ncbi:MAG: DUF2147 domain-containing protein [Gammaproteobacteria bacterium]
MKFAVKIMTVLFFMVGMFFSLTAWALDSSSPVGYWKTIDDVTGKQKSIIQIVQTSDGSLRGQVIKIWPKPGKDENEVCDACKGNNHNKRIVGMTILEGMRVNGDKWTGGQILDPNNGKTYRCSLRLVNNGASMQVHGYIGLPILGRTQTWIRVDRW